ncbi:hypothetical protein [uncultured Tissierella sp.]|uniref:hypothetical protein n=1 Tax=uncultured Tissierella sp. TaxID=448160 RepID=UPI002804AC26|nr:hypothetical protein [uncultured Tissierella sp.]MDU5081992.1 hypothetical protein [Bacillota bacterium]
MISVDIKARIKEISFSGDKSCLFVVETEGKNELVCTITKKNIELADLVKENQEIELKGNIAAYRRVKNEREYISNTLYVDSITHVEQEQMTN